MSNVTFLIERWLTQFVETAVHPLGGNGRFLLQFIQAQNPSFPAIIPVFQRQN